MTIYHTAIVDNLKVMQEANEMLGFDKLLGAICLSDTAKTALRDLVKLSVLGSPDYITKLDDLKRAGGLKIGASVMLSGFFTSAMSRGVEFPEYIQDRPSSVAVDPGGLFTISIGQLIELPSGRHVVKPTKSRSLIKTYSKDFSFRASSINGMCNEFLKRGEAFEVGKCYPRISKNELMKFVSSRREENQPKALAFFRQLALGYHLLSGRLLQSIEEAGEVFYFYETFDPTSSSDVAAYLDYAADNQD